MFSKLVAAAFMVLALSTVRTTALVVSSNATMTGLVDNIAIALRSRSKRQVGEAFLTCAKVTVRYTEPDPTKVYTMSVNKAQLSGLEAIDSSIVLSPGKFSVEVMLSAAADVTAYGLATSCALGALGTTDSSKPWYVGSNSDTFGSAVQFYGLTTEYNFYLPSPDAISVFCFDTAAAIELDQRNNIHYSPVITEMSACPGLQQGQSCDISTTGGAMNNNNNLLSGAAIFDSDWVQRIAAVSVTDISDPSSAFGLPTSVFFGTNAIQNTLVSSVSTGSPPFVSQTTSILPFSVLEGLQKIDTSANTGIANAANPDYLGKAGTTACDTAVDCVPIVFVGTNFILIHNKNGITFGSAELAVAPVYAATDFTTAIADCTNCEMLSYYPATYQVNIRAYGTEGTGEGIDCFLDDSCLSSEQSLAITVMSAAGISIGALVAHAPDSVVASYESEARQYSSAGVESSGTTQKASIEFTVKDTDFKTSGLATSVRPDGTTPSYVESLTYKISIAQELQVPSKSCSGDGSCKYVSCPPSGPHTVTLASIVGNSVTGLTGMTMTAANTNDNVYTVSLQWLPVYTCPAGEICANGVDEEIFRWYGSTYCKFVVQAEDNTGSLSSTNSATTAIQAELGIQQVLDPLKATEHTFLMSSTATSQADFDAVYQPVVQFAMVSQTKFSPFALYDVNSDTAKSTSVTIYHTNRAKASAANTNPLGFIASKSACNGADVDTGFVDGTGNSLCCTPVSNAVGEASVCQGTTTPCSGDTSECDACVQTITVAMWDTTMNINESPFATAATYELCSIYEGAQFPFTKTATSINTELVIGNGRRAARQAETGNVAIPTEPKRQNIFLDIGPDSSMTVRFSDDTLTIDTSSGVEPTPAATPTPQPTSKTADTVTSSETAPAMALLGLIGVGIVLLIIVGVVVLVVVTRKRKQDKNKVYPFWTPGELAPSKGSSTSVDVHSEGFNNNVDQSFIQYTTTGERDQY